MLIDLVTDSIRNLLQQEAVLISQLVAIRMGFENWLQLEIYRRLVQDFPSIEVALERPYPGLRERCDFWCREQDGRESWIELKLCTTNYCQRFGDTSYARPITQQVSGIVHDAEKLGRIRRESSNRHIFLLAYPMPSDRDVHAAWSRHLSRLEASSSQIDRVLAVAIEWKGRAARVEGYKILV